MARYVYIEPDDEITDLVERIRDAGGTGDELVFVLPARARVLQSVINLRLLQQYSRSFMRSSAIVSGDPRTQQLAAAAGFRAFASVAAYEHGIEAIPAALPLDAGTDPGAGPAAVAPAAPGPPVAPVYAGLDDDLDGPGAPAPATPRAPAVADRPVRSAVPPRPARTAAAVTAADRRRGLYVAAGALFRVGLLLLFLVAPTARVTVILEAQQVKEDGLTVQGTPDVGAAQQPLEVLTVAGASDESATFDFKATGQKPVAATPAATQVQFRTDLASPICMSISAGTVVAESGTLKWAVSGAPPLDTQTCKPPFAPPTGAYLVPAGSGNPGPPSTPLSVVAVTPGAAGNVAAGQVNQPDPAVNPCAPSGSPSPGTGSTLACDPSKDFTVANPAAATGGADPKTLTVVQASDLNGYGQNTTALTASLTDKVKHDMTGAAPGKVFAVDSTKSGLTITSESSPPAPKVGDQAPPDQTVTVTVHGRAALYDPRDVRARLEDKLRQDVAAVAQGARLDEHSKVLGDPVVQQSTDDGHVVFAISGSGFVTPPVDTDKLKSSFTGKGQDAVRRLVQDQYGRTVDDVQFSQSVPFPVLPFFASRIELNVCVRSPGRQC